MTLKKKVLAKSPRAIARLVANLDGKYVGLNQKDVEKAMKLMVALEAACILENYRSLTAEIRKSAKRKALKVKK